MGRINPLDAILFDIFANGHSPQEHLWAIYESLNRVKLSTKPLFHWQVRKARKKHRCRHGCLIKAGEEYYLSRDGAKETKTCVRCEARLWREDSRWLYWRVRKANKDHECAHGCPIKAGEQYFIWDGGNSDGLKMCARCMAMVLYFKNAESLTPCRYSGWDWGRNSPIHVEKPILFTGMVQ